ncbi:Minf_1886 family protein [Gemmatimonadota bacterium]
MDSIYRTINKLAVKRGRYSPEAYYFTLEALNTTVGFLPVRRHLSGPELLQGIVCLASERYESDAMNILDGWGISATVDFGNIVEDLVEIGILSKTDNERLEDFEDVFDLNEAISEEGWRQQWRIRDTGRLTGPVEDILA